jgi:hypothetical protein
MNLPNISSYSTDRQCHIPPTKKSACTSQILLATYKATEENHEKPEDSLLTETAEFCPLTHDL